MHWTNITARIQTNSEEIRNACPIVQGRDRWMRRRYAEPEHVVNFGLTTRAKSQKKSQKIAHRYCKSQVRIVWWMRWCNTFDKLIMLLQLWKWISRWETLLVKSWRTTEWVPAELYMWWIYQTDRWHWRWSIWPLTCIPARFLGRLISTKLHGHHFYM